MSFALDSLIGMLNKLGMDVEMIVRARIATPDDPNELRALQVVGEAKSGLDNKFVAAPEGARTPHALLRTVGDSGSN